jgi:hypothetical protein
MGSFKESNSRIIPCFQPKALRIPSQRQLPSPLGGGGGDGGIIRTEDAQAS